MVMKLSTRCAKCSSSRPRRWRVLSCGICQRHPGQRGHCRPCRGPPVVGGCPASRRGTLAPPQNPLRPPTVQDLLLMCCCWLVSTDGKLQGFTQKGVPLPGPGGGSWSARAARCGAWPGRAVALVTSRGFPLPPQAALRPSAGSRVRARVTALLPRGVAPPARGLVAHTARLLVCRSTRSARAALSHRGLRALQGREGQPGYLVDSPAEPMAGDEPRQVVGNLHPGGVGRRQLRLGRERREGGRSAQGLAARGVTGLCLCSPPVPEQLRTEAGEDVSGG